MVNGRPDSLRERVQELDGTLFVNMDSSTETLHDRPPLRLDAVINAPNGATFPIQVNNAFRVSFPPQVNVLATIVLIVSVFLLVLTSVRGDRSSVTTR